MADIDNGPWDGSASQWKDASSYCSACLIDENKAGEEKTKDACSFPVKTPDGKLSRAGVHAAAARLDQSGASPADKKAAANKLLGYYSQLGEQAPAVVYRIAGKQPPAKKS